MQHGLSFSMQERALMKKKLFQVAFVLTILQKNKTLFRLREEESVIVTMSRYDYDFGNIPSIPLKSLTSACVLNR